MKYYVYTTNAASAYFDKAYNTPEEAVQAARLTALNWNRSPLTAATGKVLPVPDKGDTAHVVAVVDVSAIKTGTAADGYPMCVYHHYMTPEALKAARRETWMGTEMVCV